MTFLANPPAPIPQGIPSLHRSSKNLALLPRHSLARHPQDKSFRMRTYEQTPRFARFWPKLSARNSFRIRTYKNCVCNSFRMRTYEKVGRGATHAGNLLPTIFRIFFKVPHTLSLVFSNSSKNGQGVGSFFPFWSSTPQISRFVTWLAQPPVTNHQSPSTFEYHLE